MQTPPTDAVRPRVTKYVVAVQRYLERVGHATNSEILEYVRRWFPDVSATTVHRITTRMMERGELQMAPSMDATAIRLDANLLPHDHFMCTNCGMLKDADIQSRVLPILEEVVGDGCSISGRLVISGLCKRCT